ncbi:MAG: hypothetical protein CL920_24700 [Deltaproteobacteria bacterium]|nr:hypothetical protein [Deltaproteobacteria bacterium]
MGSLHVKVMSLNIRYDNPHDGSNSWPHRKTLVCDVLRENAPDFIGLQEALKHQLEDIIHALEGYDGYGRSRRAYTEDDEWSPLCYDSKRWWLDQRQRGTFWLSDTPDHEGSQSWGSSLPRIVTWARFIEKQTNEGIYVYNTHFDHRSSEARLQSAKLLIQRIQSRECQHEPFLLMGDLNAGENTPPLRYLKGNEHTMPLVDTFREKHPDERKAGTFGGWSGSKSGPKIDYILIDAHAQTTLHDAQIIYTSKDGRYPSDHFPITAELTFSG